MMFTEPYKMKRREKPESHFRLKVQSAAGLCQCEIGHGFATAPAAFDVEGHVLTIVQLMNPCPLRGRNVGKNVIRSTLRGDEANTFWGIDPFHGATGLRDVS